MDEFCGRSDLGVGPDRPAPVVKIEGWNEVGQVDIRFPECIDRAHVTPIWLGAIVGAYATLGKRVRNSLSGTHEERDDVIAKVVSRLRVISVRPKDLEQKPCAEHID